MRAIVYTAPLELKAMEVPDPEPAEDEVIVDVAAVGICGSELHGFASKNPFRVPPLIMGHEFVGQLGDGTRVVVNPLVACRGCDMCLRGLTNLCRRRSILGIQRPGAFAERVAVPVSNCHALPDAVSTLAGALVEPLANAMHAFRLAQQYDPSPLRVGVIGAGTLGFLTAVVARDRGVPFVAIADVSDERRAQAGATGADAIGERLEAGDFDVVFDAVGTPGTRRASVSQLRPGGTAVWIGLHDAEAGMDSLALIRNEQRVLGTFCYQEQDYQAAILRAATLEPDWVSTYPLEEGVDVFQRLLGGDVSRVKSMLLPGGAEDVGADRRRA